MNTLRLTPRSADGVLRVVLPARISTPEQDLESLNATQSDNERWLLDNYDGPQELTRIGEQTSGWTVDRPEIEYVQQRIRAGEIDLVLLSEIRDLFRNPKLIWEFVQLCVDHQTRVIIRWDGIDTAGEDWETMLHLATLKAGMFVPETRKRVRRKAEHEFKQGGWVQKIRFGYRKLTRDEAESGLHGPVGLRLEKVSECTATILEMRDLILNHGYTDIMVAKHLNARNIAPGPYATSGKWTGRLVRNLLIDPVLSGCRSYRKTVSRFIYGLGKHRPEPNPTPLQTEESVLAHMTTEEQQSLVEYYAERREKTRKLQHRGPDDPQRGIPRGHSCWPGLGLLCTACGYPYYTFGKLMKCRGGLSENVRQCWNHTQLQVERVRQGVLPLLLEALNADPAARRMIVQYAWTEYDRKQRDTGTESQYLESEVRKCERIKANCVKLLADAADLTSVAAELKRVEALEKQLRARQEELRTRDPLQQRYASAAEIEADLPGVLSRMMASSREFGALLRSVLRCRVVPVQALDCPQVRSRLEVVISFKQYARDEAAAYEACHVLDLFDPPQHIAHMQTCVDARQAHPDRSLRKLQDITGVGYMTIKRALGYHRLMVEAGHTEPYRVLTEPPAQASRWRKRARKHVASMQS